MSSNSDDSSDEGSTCFLSENESSSSKSLSGDLASSVSSRSIHAVEISFESSFSTPVPGTVKKKIRRTNVQIQADAAAKAAMKLIDSGIISDKKSNPNTKSKATMKPVPQSTKVTETTIIIGDVTFPLQTARTVWTTKEQMDLIWCYRSWEDGAKLSQNKKLIPINKLWLTHIPNLMGKRFGRVRATPNNVLANSPYQSKWLGIRQKVSDYKAAQVDGREEELPDIEGPTGGGLNEDGVEDDRMIAAAAAETAKDKKRNSRYVAGIEEESLKIIQYFIETFPQSVSGIGLVTESELSTGAGSKREFCETEGLRDTAAKEDVGGGPPVKKVSKSSLIIDLTRTAAQHHEESMAFNRVAFDYQKQIRIDDMAKREERDQREIEYRDKQDSINNERYEESRKDNLNIQNTFANILTNLITKM